MGRLGQEECVSLPKTHGVCLPKQYASQKAYWANVRATGSQRPLPRPPSALRVNLPPWVGGVQVTECVCTRVHGAA